MFLVTISVLLASVVCGLRECFVKRYMCYVRVNNGSLLVGGTLRQFGLPCRSRDWTLLNLLCLRRQQKRCLQCFQVLKRLRWLGFVMVAVVAECRRWLRFVGHYCSARLGGRIVAAVVSFEVVLYMCVKASGTPFSYNPPHSRPPLFPCSHERMPQRPQTTPL